jgi:hypothetical protein
MSGYATYQALELLFHDFNVRQLEGFVPKLFGATIKPHDGTPKLQNRRQSFTVIFEVEREIAHAQTTELVRGSSSFLDAAIGYRWRQDSTPRLASAHIADVHAPEPDVSGSPQSVAGDVH